MSKQPKCAKLYVVYAMCYTQGPAAVLLVRVCNEHAATLVPAKDIQDSNG